MKEKNLWLNYIKSKLKQKEALILVKFQYFKSYKNIFKNWNIEEKWTGLVSSFAGSSKTNRGHLKLCKNKAKNKVKLVQNIANSNTKLVFAVLNSKTLV